MDSSIWVAIITAGAAMGGAFFGSRTKIAVIETKFDSMDKKIEKIENTQKDHEEKINSIGTAVAILERAPKPRQKKAGA